MALLTVGVLTASVAYLISYLVTTVLAPRRAPKGLRDVPAYAARPDPYARDHFDFEAGRRICPGMHLFENSLFITIACIIWAFDVLPPLENAKVGTVDVSDAAYEAGANTLPKPSKLRVVPRSSTVETTLRRIGRNLR